MPISRTALALPAAVLTMAAVAAFAADPPAPALQASAPAAHVVQTPRPVHPAAHRACLSKSEQRAAVAAHQAISLADAIRTLRAHGRRAEVVRARLCRKGDKLVYLLTLLGHSGKVRAVHIDAVSGDLMAGR